jgi:hypothetical protein
MSETKKSGFFSRLFKRDRLDEEAPGPTAEIEERIDEEIPEEAPEEIPEAIIEEAEILPEQAE